MGDREDLMAEFFGQRIYLIQLIQFTKLLASDKELSPLTCLERVGVKGLHSEYRYVLSSPEFNRDEFRSRLEIITRDRVRKPLILNVVEAAEATRDYLVSCYQRPREIEAVVVVRREDLVEALFPLDISAVFHDSDGPTLLAAYCRRVGIGLSTYSITTDMHLYCL